MSAHQVRLLSYATSQFRVAQQLNTSTGIGVGGVGQVSQCSRTSLDWHFRWANRAILRQPRGAGYWLWKPYLIRRHLERIGRDEWLFYCDAGAYFVGPIAPLVEHARGRDLEVMIFEGYPELVEQIWTKRDAFVLLDCDMPEFRETPQRGGGYSLWRRTPATMDLAAEWLDRCRDPRLLTDMPNTCGLPNYPGFQEHRHDQSIFGLLTKQRGIPAFRDISQHGNNMLELYPDCTYPQTVQTAPHTNPVGVDRLRHWLGRKRREMWGPGNSGLDMCGAAYLRGPRSCQRWRRVVERDK